MSFPVPSKSSRDQESSQNLRGVSQNFISISSDELQQQVQVEDTRKQQDIEFKPISKPVNLEEQARKRELRLQKAIQDLRSLQKRNKENESIYGDVAAKIQNKRQMMKQQNQLKKEFTPYSTFLPISSLRFVKSQLSNFEKYCHFEQLSQNEKIYESHKPKRQDFRRLLTRGMLLSIEQIKCKVKESQLTQLQQNLLNPQTDCLKYCYMIATSIQKYFFIKLRKNAKNPDQRYQSQIKLILREYSDKNNLQLRRNILNNRVSPKQLATATDQSIKCQKTKQEEQEKLRILVRQSQLNPFAQNQIQEESQSAPNGSYNNINSTGNIPEPMDEQPKQTAQERHQRQKKQMIADLREKYKKCEQTFMKLSRQMTRREELLHQAQQKNTYFQELWRNMEM